MSAKPYMTSNALVDSITRRISYPLSQKTHTYNDVLAMASEELKINLVPSIMEERMEYFVFKVFVDMVPNVSRYEIPYRSIGMTLRDLKSMDSGGNLYDMSRIAPEDKAFFQSTSFNNSSAGKYYIEGNEIVISPDVSITSNTKLVFYIYLRPNELVRDDRAATIQSFQRYITVSNNSLIQAGDEVTVQYKTQSSTPVVQTLTAVVGSPSANQFQIGATVNDTAINISNAISVSGVTASALTNVVTITSNRIDVEFSTNSDGIVASTNQGIVFDALPSTYTDPVTDITTPLFTQGSLIDVLQTNPGHRTYAYDIELLSLNGNVGLFSIDSLKTYVATNANVAAFMFVNVKVGDYIALAGESIIPQVPPELHTALAEQTAITIQTSIGDREGAAASKAKSLENRAAQATMIGTRIEGAPVKVFNKRSLLRIGKSRGLRRF